MRECPDCGAPYEWKQKLSGPVLLSTCSCASDRTEKEVEAFLERLRKRRESNDR